MTNTLKIYITAHCILCHQERSLKTNSTLEQSTKPLKAEEQQSFTKQFVGDGGRPTSAEKCFYHILNQVSND